MNVGDQDKIAVFFCHDRGVLRGVAKGARKFGNRFGSSLEPMSVVRVFYYEKERRDLVTVSGCDLLESFFEMQAEPATAFLLTYFAELIEEFAPARAREDVLYRLLLSSSAASSEGTDSRGPISGLVPPRQRPARSLRCQACRKPSPRLSPRKDGAWLPRVRPSRKGGPAGTQAFLRWTRRTPPQEAAPRLSPPRTSRDPKGSPGHDRLPWSGTPDLHVLKAK
jgi:DNA repair protein RecO (recombination protein O)